MNSFTYMRSELDRVWQIPFEQATMRCRRLIGSKSMQRATLIFQDLEAPTRSARIRTGVNEMMTWFVTTPLPYHKAHRQTNTSNPIPKKGQPESAHPCFSVARACGKLKRAYGLYRSNKLSNIVLINCRIPFQ